MRTVLFLVQKEFLQVFRNKFMLPMLLVLPVVQTVILSFAANYEIKNLSLGVVDHDLSPMSRQLVAKFGASGYFKVANTSFSAREADADLAKDRTDLILEIPPHFERDFVREGTAAVSLTANAINAVKAGLALGYANSIVQSFTMDGGRLTVDGGRETVDGGRETVDGGRETVDGGRETVDGGRLTGDGGRETVDGGRETVDGLQTAMPFDNADASSSSAGLEPSTVYRLPSTVHRLPSTVSRPPSTVSRPSSTVHRPPSTVHRLPSTVSRPPSPVRRPPSIVQITYSNWYNPRLDYKTFMVPGILSVIISMIIGFLTALNIVREREIGTIEQLNVTPIHKWQFILGKLLPFWMISLVMLSVGLTVGWLIFRIPILGDLRLVFLYTLVYAPCMLGIGFLISNFAESQQQAMFTAWFFLIIFVLMCGLFTPTDSMPQWAQYLNMINPVKYFVDFMRLVLLKGAGFADIRQNFFTVLGYAVTVNALAVWTYRKRV